ncbi:MAG: hypothetical protein A3F18_01385 [Legionellales bacterium RIFCSPHIGHO2_12_FULL_37_14]|nr:MAG: hypothetical protein A3F18_01385 [Legionellales bacterium RIFCSPHIGHO2_12_FULL_37_14]
MKTLEMFTDMKWREVQSRFNKLKDETLAQEQDIEYSEFRGLLRMAMFHLEDLFNTEENHKDLEDLTKDEIALLSHITSMKKKCCEMILIVIEGIDAKSIKVMPGAKEALYAVHAFCEAINHVKHHHSKQALTSYNAISKYKDAARKKIESNSQINHDKHIYDLIGYISIGCGTLLFIAGIISCIFGGDYIVRGIVLISLGLASGDLGLHFFHLARNIITLKQGIILDQTLKNDLKRLSHHSS